MRPWRPPRNAAAAGELAGLARMASRWTHPHFCTRIGISIGLGSELHQRGTFPPLDLPCVGAVRAHPSPTESSHPAIPPSPQPRSPPPQRLSGSSPPPRSACTRAAPPPAVPPPTRPAGGGLALARRSGGWRALPVPPRCPPPYPPTPSLSPPSFLCLLPPCPVRHNGAPHCRPSPLMSAYPACRHPPPAGPPPHGRRRCRRRRSLRDASARGRAHGGVPSLPPSPHPPPSPAPLWAAAAASAAVAAVAAAPAARAGRRREQPPPRPAPPLLRRLPSPPPIVVLFLVTLFSRRLRGRSGSAGRPAPPLPPRDFTPSPPPPGGYWTFQYPLSPSRWGLRPRRPEWGE